VVGGRRGSGRMAVGRAASPLIACLYTCFALDNGDSTMCASAPVCRISAP